MQRSGKETKDCETDRFSLVAPMRPKIDDQNEREGVAKESTRQPSSKKTRIDEWDAPELIEDSVITFEIEHEEMQRKKEPTHQPGAVAVTPSWSPTLTNEEIHREPLHAADENQIEPPDTITAELAPSINDIAETVRQLLTNGQIMSPIAVAVADPAGGSIVEGEPKPNTFTQSSCCQGRNKIRWLLAAVVVSVVAIAIVVVVVLVTRSKTTQPTEASSLSPTQNPTAAPTTPTRSDEFRRLLWSLNVSGQELWNTSSAQYQALKWLTETDRLKLQLNSTDNTTTVERYIMALLFYATKGENWTKKFDFLSPSHTCNWHDHNDVGVVCDSNHRIRHLNLINNTLRGFIPGEVGMLTHLTFLSFGRNFLTGTVPTEVGLLHELTYLAFESNFVSGTIPSEIGWLTNLEQLFLWEMNLTGPLPHEIGNLRQVSLLNFNSNGLSGSIPSSIGQLSHLTSLDLTFNDFSGTIPTDIGNLHRLQVLGIGGNKFIGTLPTQIGKMSLLIELYAWKNDLAGVLPSELGELSNLNALMLHSNKFVGTVPKSLVKLSQLDELWLEFNHFYGNLTPIFCDGRNWSQFYSDCQFANLSCTCCTRCCNEAYCSGQN